ncbi:MAG: type II toxin-antitoxin system Phd/YefM family antitoxin [Patescibacteria group bacterium]
MIIKSIDATTLRNNLSDAIKEVNRTGRPLVINHRRLPKAVLMDIGEYEDYLASQDPEYLKTITRARAEVKAGKVVPFEEIYTKVFGSVDS